MIDNKMLFWEDIGKLFLFFGGILILFGLLFTFGVKIPFFGRLPGDIVIHHGDFHFYFPLATCILISLIITIIFWIVKALKG